MDTRIVMGNCCKPNNNKIVHNNNKNIEDDATVPSPLTVTHPSNISSGDMVSTKPINDKSNVTTAVLSSEEVILEEVSCITLHDPNASISKSTSKSPSVTVLNGIEKLTNKSNNVDNNSKQTQQGTKRLSTTARRGSSTFDPRHSINEESIELSNLSGDLSSGKNIQGITISSPAFQSVSDRYMKSKLVRIVSDEYQFDLNDREVYIDSSTNEIQLPKPILIKQKQIRQMGKEALKNLITLQKFMKHLKDCDSEKHYSIVVDASASMFNEKYYENKKMEFDQRWKAAQKLVEALIPKITDCYSSVSEQKRGTALYFFSDGYSKHTNIQTADEVKSLFHSKSNKLRGR